MYLQVTVSILLALNSGEAQYQYYTSNDAIEDLYEMELTLISQVGNYIKEQQNILNLLIGRYEQAVLTLSNTINRQRYISNPINAFSLICRLTRDWPKTLSLVEDKLLRSISLPTEEDFAGAVRALTRLQDVYELSAKALALGLLPGTHRRALLTAADCVSVAQFYQARMDYSLATDWLLQALDKVYKDKSCPPGLVLENLLITTCFEGDHELSSYYHHELVDRYPFYLPPDSLLKDYNLALRGKCEEVAEARRKVRVKSIPELNEEEIIEYNEICRGSVPQLIGLRCHLVHYHRPHLRFQPFKLEELHLEPPVVMFHQVLSDQEINYFQHTAYPLVTKKENGSPFLVENAVSASEIFHFSVKHVLCVTFHTKSGLFPIQMKPAKVRMPDKSLQVADYRTSHIAWVDDSDPVSARLSRRLAAMTNLDISSAEMNQVSNYGLAGEYVTHLDAIEGINLTEGDPDGNRLATSMIYMSDVPWGGHTVFPDLEISIKPRKGAALFWYNLHHDGTIDYRMRHASCPVVVGTKWVLNKWFHEAGQDLLSHPPCLRYLEDSRMYFYL